MFNFKQVSVVGIMQSVPAAPDMRNNESSERICKDDKAFSAKSNTSWLADAYTNSMAGKKYAKSTNVYDRYL